MKLNKRLSQLEAITAPEKPVMKSLGELYEWQQTPSGKAELDNLYNENRDNINPNLRQNDET